MAQAHTPTMDLKERTAGGRVREGDRDREMDLGARGRDGLGGQEAAPHQGAGALDLRSRDWQRSTAFIVKQVVEEVEDPLAEWTLEEAQAHDPDAEIGVEIHIPVSTEGLGRIAAQSAKQVLYQRIREAEREKVYNEFIDRVGEVVNGTVKRFERGDIVVDLGRTEAAVPRSSRRVTSATARASASAPSSSTFTPSPRARRSSCRAPTLACWSSCSRWRCRRSTTAPCRSRPRSAHPGERAKVAVYSRERDVDPVGACVGMKGSRVQSIIRELRGEKIDIIEHSDDLVTLAQSALAPARITRVSVTHHGEEPHLDVIVEDEQLSLAIGKRGQNVRLAAELLGAKIDIKSESDVKDEVTDALARMLQGTALGSDDRLSISPPYRASTPETAAQLEKEWLRRPRVAGSDRRRAGTGGGRRRRGRRRALRVGCRQVVEQPEATPRGRGIRGLAGDGRPGLHGCPESRLPGDEDDTEPATAAPAAGDDQRIHRCSRRSPTGPDGRSHRAAASPTRAGLRLRSRGKTSSEEE